MRWWSQLRERFESWRFGAVDPHASLGKRGEQFAARFLRRAGYKILAHGNLILLANWTLL